MTEVGLQDLEQALAARALLLDVRESDEYAADHVPGAQLLPLSGSPKITVVVEVAMAKQTIGLLRSLNAAVEVERNLEAAMTELFLDHHQANSSWRVMKWFSPTNRAVSRRWRPKARTTLIPPNASAARASISCLCLRTSR